MASDWIALGKKLPPKGVEVLALSLTGRQRVLVWDHECRVFRTPKGTERCEYLHWKPLSQGGAVKKSRRPTDRTTADERMKNRAALLLQAKGLLLRVTARLEQYEGTDEIDAEIDRWAMQLSCEGVFGGECA